MAPLAGFEPATKRLTVVYSTAELQRNIIYHLCINRVHLLCCNYYIRLDIRLFIFFKSRSFQERKKLGDSISI